MYTQLLNIVTGALAVNMGIPVTAEVSERFVPEFMRVVVYTFLDNF